MLYDTRIRGLQADYTRTKFHPTYTTRDRVKHLKTTLNVTNRLLQDKGTPHVYMPELETLKRDLTKSILKLA